MNKTFLTWVRYLANLKVKRQGIIQPKKRTNGAFGQPKRFRLAK